MLRLEIAIVVIPFAALQVFAIKLKFDDEASMRAAFVSHAFVLNTKLSSRVALLGAGEILLVTPFTWSRAELLRVNRSQKR